MKGQKNDKKIVFFLIIIITLILYYGIRKNEENYDKLQEMESKNKKDLSINKLLKGQIEDDIHLNNSKLLNTRVEVEEIKKVILKEEMEKENYKNKNNKNDVEKFKIELWKIETFFLSFFCILIGGLYFYAKDNEQKTKIEYNENNYRNNNKDYILADSEIEYLINKEELNNYQKYDDEQ